MSDLLRGEAGFGRCKSAAVRTPYLGRYQIISLRSNYRRRMRFRGGLKRPLLESLCVSFAVYDFASLCFPLINDRGYVGSFGVEVLEGRVLKVDLNVTSWEIHQQ
ncbi:hypothetical protein J3E69DRAFT_345760 [Trichoderma sp. SZMC 28015]